MTPDDLNSVPSIYVDPDERFVVALVVSYADDKQNETGGVPDALTAASATLQLTRDGGSSGTTWFVLDRQTGEWDQFEQSEFEDIPI